MTDTKPTCEHAHGDGECCCELCHAADATWSEEPTAVTKMLDEMRASLAEARETLTEQRAAVLSLRSATEQHTARQLRRSLTPQPFPAAAAGSKGS